MNTNTTSATNISGPNASSASTLDTNQYFTNLYTIDLSIGPDINDALVAFFQEYTGNKIAGQNLAGTVLYTAKAQNLNPMQVLDNFQKLSKDQMNSYLLAFLNSTRVPTSALGIKTTSSTSSFIKRTILL